jgi:hypothetical protein
MMLSSCFYIFLRTESTILMPGALPDYSPPRCRRGSARAALRGLLHGCAEKEHFCDFFLHHLKAARLPP